MNRTEKFIIRCAWLIIRDTEGYDAVTTPRIVCGQSFVWISSRKAAGFTDILRDIPQAFQESSEVVLHIASTLSFQILPNLLLVSGQNTGRYMWCIFDSIHKPTPKWNI